MLIATSGHVDHGKTSLVRALTGVDTDRLPEEKARGLTIDLGFAYCETPSGHRLGFVDVPGHEKFIRNMIAGVPAIDYALLVVAADDGPMPQTREHLAIVDLLGIRRGAVVISKIDRVDSGRVAQVREALRSVLAGSALDAAPVFAVSTQTGEGLESLRSQLAEAAASSGEREALGRFRLAIDRVFSPTGAGLVVTGAVYDGVIAVGDRVALLPHGSELRVRAIEQAGRSVNETHAGQRAAINLSGRGVSVTDVSRGDWLVAQPAPAPSDRVDAWFSLLASEERELKHWSAVHAHHGAGFFNARISPLAGAPIAPGQSGWVQIVLERATQLSYGDRLLLRDASGRRTIGGAQVVEVYAPRRVRDREQRIALLSSARNAPLDTAIAYALGAVAHGVDAQALADARNVSVSVVESLLAQMAVTRLATRHGERLISRTRSEAMAERIESWMNAAHRAMPERVGCTRDEVLRGCAQGEPKLLLEAVLEQLIRDARVARDGALLRLSTHQPQLPARDASRLRRLRKVLTPTTLKAPSVSDLAQQMNLPRDEMLEFLRACERRGQLVRVADNRYFDPGALVALARVAQSLAQSRPEGRFDAKGFRDASEIGRNLSIDVLEYFDRRGFTRRLGDLRIVVKSPESLFL